MKGMAICIPEGRIFQPEGAAHAQALRREWPWQVGRHSRRPVCLGLGEQEEEWKEWKVEEVVNVQIFKTLEVKVRHAAFTVTWEPSEDF